MIAGNHIDVNAMLNGETIRLDGALRMAPRRRPMRALSTGFEGAPVVRLARPHRADADSPIAAEPTRRAADSR
ncbi:MAG: hypothetical protein JWR80_8792 [Bradyrhizobium sp.]|nr:hypothetical protein [Bradyrhizobium sp.]